MSRQFDVFPNPSRRGRLERPFVIILQSRLWDEYAGRLCAPLVAKRFINPKMRLNPGFTIRDEMVYLHPLEIASVPAKLLREPIANLEAERDRILAALDLVFTGI